jgi:hypothetical protein
MAAEGAGIRAHETHGALMSCRMRIFGPHQDISPDNITGKAAAVTPLEPPPSSVPWRNAVLQRRRSCRRSVRRLTPWATTATVATVAAVRATGAGPMTAARRIRRLAKGMSIPPVTAVGWIQRLDNIVYLSTRRRCRHRLRSQPAAPGLVCGHWPPTVPPNGARLTRTVPPRCSPTPARRPSYRVRSRRRPQ